MNSQQLELRALHRNHLANLIALQQQRQLLLSDNPFHKASLLQQPQKETYIANPTTQSLLYKPRQNIDQNQKFKEAHTQFDRKIAEKSIQTILRAWNNQHKYSQQGLYLQKIRKQGMDLQFESELTPSGRLQIDQILQEARSSGKLGPFKPIRQKYINQSVQQKLSDLYSHISKMKKLEDQ